jgi:hypothetical protein
VLDGYCLEDLLTKRRDLQWILAAAGDDIGKQDADQAQM